MCTQSSQAAARRRRSNVRTQLWRRGRCTRIELRQAAWERHLFFLPLCCVNQRVRAKIAWPRGTRPWWYWAPIPELPPVEPLAGKGADVRVHTELRLQHVAAPAARYAACHHDPFKQRPTACATAAIITTRSLVGFVGLVGLVVPPPPPWHHHILVPSPCKNRSTWTHPQTGPCTVKREAIEASSAGVDAQQHPSQRSASPAPNL